MNGIIRPTPEVIDDAVQLVDRYPLTAYDAIQLASAIHCEQVVRSVSAYRAIFVVADQRVLAATRSEGLVAEDPEQH